MAYCVFRNRVREQVIRMPSLKHCNMEQMNVCSCEQSLITYNLGLGKYAPNAGVLGEMG